MNSSLHDAILAFNYSFDYTEFDTDLSIRTQPHIFAPALKLAIVILTFVFMAILLAIIGRYRANGHRGFCCYAANLAIVNFMTTVFVILNDKDLNFLFKDTLFNQLRSRAKLYHFNIVELSNIVFCSTTFFLITDSTNRYRRNTPGFTWATWLAISLSCDFIPLVYIIIQAEYFPYTFFTPKPLAVYHITWWILFSVASSSFITASLCCLRKRKLESFGTAIPLNTVSDQSLNDPFSRNYAQAFHQPNAELFSRWHLVRLSLYLIATAWIQIPTGATVFPDLIAGRVDPKAGMKLMPVVQPMIRTLLEINTWSIVCMPLVETVASLVLLPSFGDRCFPAVSTFKPNPSVVSTVV